MPRLWFCTSNDRKLLPCVLTAAGVSEEQMTSQSRGIYGAAIFASGSDVLTLKRPVSPGTKLAGFDGRDLRTNRFLGFHDPDETAVFRNDDVQPFRHKGWVMAQIGTAPPHMNYPENPLDADFIRHNLRGFSTHEFFFHRVLARLYHTHPVGGKDTSPEVIVGAVYDVLEELDDKEQRDFTLALTCENMGVVITRGRDVRYRTVRGIKNCSRCSSTSRKAHNKIMVSHKHASAVVVVDGLEVSGQAWKSLAPDNALVVASEPPAYLIDFQTYQASAPDSVEDVNQAEA
ncbi:MAG TPA: hypothetical protein EYN66_19480 [Myxococcales bacterium]|nr:hypothetical protein [Myxococcales bacterium]